MDMNKILNKAVQNALSEYDKLFLDFVWNKYQKLSDKKTCKTDKEFLKLIIIYKDIVKKSQCIVVAPVGLYFTAPKSAIILFDGSGKILSKECLDRTIEQFNKENLDKEVVQVIMCDDEKFKALLNDIE